MGDNGDDRVVLQNTDELQEALAELKNKNVELKKIISYIQTDNSSYKQKYKCMRKKLLNLTDLLEKNAKVCNQLFDNAKCALQLSRVSMINSPVSQRTGIPLRYNNPKDEFSVQLMKSAASRNLDVEHADIENFGTGSPKAGPSGIVTSSTSSSSHVRTIKVRKLHIEPLNMKEFEQIEADNEDHDVEVSNTGIRSIPEELSTIMEESSKAQELLVKMERLPAELLESHLGKKKNTPLSNNSSINVDGDLLNDPAFASTPLKIDTMRKYIFGNCENNLYQFVNPRKKITRSCTSSGSKPSSSNTLLSPKKEKISLGSNRDSKVNDSPSRSVSSSYKENSISLKKEKSIYLQKGKKATLEKERKSLTPQKENSLTKNRKRQLNTPAKKTKAKRKKSIPEVSPRRHPRLARRARPTNLKEETLREKKRRN
ncbi:uncharacterized protein LOC135132397 isoform X2 [Zophobas morio]|uniref:uncharacterized protein LOC135132397 isoform X2 n=1 Tax=Zophobas morio TaxID=2755281 RepID=UPI003083E25C